MLDGLGPWGTACSGLIRGQGFFRSRWRAPAARGNSQPSGRNRISVIPGTASALPGIDRGLRNISLRHFRGARGEGGERPAWCFARQPGKARMVPFSENRHPGNTRSSHADPRTTDRSESRPKPTDPVDGRSSSGIRTKLHAAVPFLPALAGSCRLCTATARHGRPWPTLASPEHIAPSAYVRNAWPGRELAIGEAKRARKTEPAGRGARAVRNGLRTARCAR